MASVEFVEATLGIGGLTVLRDVSLKVAQGEFVGLIGPSGSGKTSLLRAIAGLVDVVSGAILMNGVDVSQASTGDRDVSMVFEDPTLFNDRTARRNLSFPLEIRRQHIDEIRQRVGAEARAMHLEHLLERRPDQLSRGESQLVQIARAMVRTPGVLLLDEPLASLDEPTKARLRTELGMLQAGYGLTTVMATNDPRDAMTMPSKLAVIADGTVVQCGSPDAVRSSPCNLDAALSTGECSTIPALVERDSDGFWLVGRGPSGSLPFRHRAWSAAFADRIGDCVTVGLRPIDVEVHPTGSVLALVTRSTPGQTFGLQCEVAGRRIGVVDPGDAEVGDLVPLRIRRVLVFDSVTGRSIV